MPSFIYDSTIRQSYTTNCHYSSLTENIQVFKDSFTNQYVSREQGMIKNKN